MPNEQLLTERRRGTSGPGMYSTAAGASPKTLRTLVRTVISIMPFGNVLTRAVLSLGFRDSPSYWERRYAEGHDSGAGSYGLLADFKGEFLRKFMRENAIHGVIDFGCGDGSQIAQLETASYVGLDVSETAIRICRNKYREDRTKTFVHYDSKTRFEDLRLPHADLAMSLDVIFHLVEDDVFEAYVANLFNAAARFVVVYSSNFDAVTESPHVRHRAIVSYVERNVPGWVLHDRRENPNKGALSGSDFYVFRHDRANAS